MTARVRGAPWAALLVAALVAVLFAPTVMWLARTWSVHPYYAHGPLIPIVAAWLAWRRRAAWAGAAPWDAGWVVVVLGAGAHLAALRWEAHFASAAALVVVLLGLAGVARGRRAVSALGLPALVLALGIPIPAVERLAPALAAGVARAAAAVVAPLGVAVAQRGAELSLAGGAFVVGAPCSGLSSLVALVTLAVVLAGVLDGPRRWRASLVALAVPLALAANGARLAGLLWVADTFGVDTGLAFFHGPASPALYLLAASTLVVAARRMGCDVHAGAVD